VCGSATITIVSRTTGFSGQTFAFTGDLGSFVLPEQGNPTPSDQHVFTLVPGRYSVKQSFALPLQGLTCSPDAAATIDRSSRTVTVVVNAGESVTCTFTNDTGGVGLGAPPPGTVIVLPSINSSALNFKPPIGTTPSTQPTAVPTTTPGTDSGASSSPSGLVGKALPATSGESSAGGFSAVWLFLVLGILALFFLLLLFLWRRKKEEQQEPSP
jgi:hypothetical protein